MKHALIYVATICTVTLSAFAAKPAINANAKLKDGSNIKGEFLTKRVVGTTLFTTNISLNPKTIKTLTFLNTNGEANVELVNSDKFSMKVANEKFAIKSLLGELKLPRASLESISFSKKAKPNKAPSKGLIFHCTFDNEEALSSPKIGPKVKLELGKLKENFGKKGGSLFVNPGIAGAEICFPKGFFGKEGTIEFWANMASGKTEFSTGGDPRFFIINTAAGNEIANLEFASNNGCGNSGFCCNMCGLRAYTNRGFSFLKPYSDVFKGADYNGWHHYKLIWTTDSVSLFIDEKCVAKESGNINIKELTDSEIIMSIPLNRVTGKSFNNKSAFYIDEFKIWNYAKETLKN